MRDLKRNSVTSSRIKVKVRPFCLCHNLTKKQKDKKISLQTLYIFIQILLSMIVC